MTFLSISVRMWAWAALLRGLKHVVPMPTLVRLAQRGARGGGQEELEERITAYLRTRGRFPFRPPGNCLERSLGAYRLLCQAGARPELVIGVKRSGSRVDGHVWVTVAGRAIGEDTDDLETFTTIVTFDASGRQLTAAGFDGALSNVRVR